MSDDRLKIEDIERIAAALAGGVDPTDLPTREDLAALALDVMSKFPPRAGVVRASQARKELWDLAVMVGQINGAIDGAEQQAAWTEADDEVLAAAQRELAGEVDHAAVAAEALVHFELRKGDDTDRGDATGDDDDADKRYVPGKDTVWLHRDDKGDATILVEEITMALANRVMARAIAAGEQLDLEDAIGAVKSSDTVAVWDELEDARAALPDEIKTRWRGGGRFAVEPGEVDRRTKRLVAPDGSEFDTSNLKRTRDGMVRALRKVLARAKSVPPDDGA